MRKTLNSELSAMLYRAVLETLEKRVLLCADSHGLLELGIPKSQITDGHITRPYFETLSAEVQARIDPHSIAEVYDKPINYDEMYGIPLSVTMGDGAGPDADTFPDWYPAVNGSISVSQTSQPGRTLVNFPTAINNQGSGPGIGISGRPGIDPIPSGAPITSWLRADGSQAVLQPIWNYNAGTFTLSYYRDAGSFTYHSGHTHYHYEGYNNYRLRQNVGGQPGPYVTHRPDGTEIIGEKIGFCLINVGSSFTMENGQSSTTLPGYNAAQQGTGCGFSQGVHVGKYDQYGAGTTGQWLDVTGVPNGNYFLEITVDGENVMQETNEGNNTKNFPFTINVNPPTGGTQPDVFDTAGNNDTFTNATNKGVTTAHTQGGLTIHWGQDYDFFRFVAPSNGLGTVSASAASGNIDLYLYDSNQNQIAASTQGSGPESISWNFVAGQTYYAKGEAYNSTIISNYQIAWSIKPTVNAVTNDGSANELGSNFGTIALARNGQTDNPLGVNFSVGGTAIRGTDYQIYFDGFEVLGNTVSIGSANSQAALEIRPIYDNSPEVAETVTIAVAASAAYEVGGGPGSVTIGDAGPEVSQTAHVWQTAPNKLVLDIDRALLATVNLGDFQIMNLDTSVPVTGQTLANQDFGTFVRATLTFSPGVLADAEYQLTVPAGTMTNSLGDINATPFAYDFFQLTGDANHDGRVNLFDYNILTTNYNQSPRDFSQGDFNYDNLVNIADYNLFANKYGTDFNTDGAQAAGSPLRGGRTAPGGIFAAGKEIGDSDKDLEDLI